MYEVAGFGIDVVIASTLADHFSLALRERNSGDSK